MTGTDDRHLRVGTAQREHAIELLRNAAADERITFDELESRVPRALGAVTRGDLADILDDLVPADALQEVVGGEASLGEGPGYHWDEPLLLAADGWRPIRVAGAWQVPPFLEIQGGTGGAVLDFSRAVTRASLIDLVLINTRYGTTQLVVPPGWGVDVQGVHADGSSNISTTVPTRPERGLPRIVVRGRSNASLKVRHTKDADARRAERWLRKGELAVRALDA